MSCKCILKFTSFFTAVSNLKVINIFFNCQKLKNISNVILFRWRLAFFILVLSIVCSCKKFVTVAPPTNRFVNSNVFTSDATATSALVGIYSSIMQNNFASGDVYGVTNLSALSADEFSNYSTDVTQIEFYTNSISIQNSAISSNLWSEPYQYIYDANSILEGLNNNSGVTTQVNKEITGEAEFTRAFCYFYLVNLFGDVPLVTTSQYHLNATISRTPKAKIYEQIISDLINAQNILARDYSYSNGERVRPNYWAATALLARTYLYTRDWENAEVQATAIINNTGMFTLMDNLNNVFLANSSETIWQLLPFRYYTNEGNNFILASNPSDGIINSKTISNQLLAAFEAGDNRRSNWIDSIIVSGQIYYFPYKYKTSGNGTTLTEYSMVFRLAEQYLIRAEARARQGKITGPNSAETDLNIIRNRAGLNKTTASTQEDMLTAILHERQVELFTEWGHRWLDIKRTGLADAVFGIDKPGWKSTDSLYPIPYVQIQNDPGMKNAQNPGY